ncbi:hypothetical protein PAXRUDRAFT_566948 [Paxillus rubicundulus Ve08.2h10]|uniref:Uncharacterized protein n=1 Tax=Paxillus rubicundulus Ve08.2h10 TaxID=930991 RepID=A0A0D0D6U1_9AGAM|nr:hypothetical protein PAXRUDRAFT_566948 [Paxillus rubicundulus Ve08.2h10]
MKDLVINYQIQLRLPQVLVTGRYQICHEQPLGPLSSSRSPWFFLHSSTINSLVVHDMSVWMICNLQGPPARSA